MPDRIPLAWRPSASRKLWRDLWFGPHGTFNQHWRDVMDNDPGFESVSMIVELIFGGGITIRMATRPVELTRKLDGRNTTLLYDPILLEEPEINHTYNFGGGTSSARSFALSLMQSKLDVFKIIREGHMLAGWAEISLAVDGQDWEDRFVIMRGDMAGGVVFGGADEVIEIEVVDPVETMDISITPWFCTQGDDDSAANFEDLPDASNGMRFPLILNSYEKYEMIRLETDATPMLMAGWGHDLDVTAMFQDGVEDTGYSVIQGIDANGVPWTGVQKGTYTSTGDMEDTTSMYCSAERTNKSRDLLQCIKYLVEEWSLLGPPGYNSELHSIAQAKLNLFTYPKAVINGSSGNTGTQALAYVEGTLCESFPMVSMTYWGGGYGPVVTDRRSKKIRMALEAGQYPLASRVTSFQETAKGDLFNRYTLRWGYNPMDDVWNGTSARDSTNSTLCRISEDMAGIRDFGTIDSVIIQDASAAAYVLDWLVAHYALPSYYVEYEGYPALFMKLRLGDNITLVDSDIGPDSVAGTVEKIAYQAGRVTVGLRLWMLYSELGGGSTGAAVSAGSVPQTTTQTIGSATGND